MKNLKRLILMMVLITSATSLFAADNLFSLKSESASQRLMAQTVNEPLKLILEENTSAEVTLLNMHAALLTENTDEIALPLEQD